jgi:hypothetical protein
MHAVNRGFLILAKLKWKYLSQLLATLFITTY